MKPGYHLRVSRLFLSLIAVCALWVATVSASCSECDPDNGGHCDAAWHGQPGKFCGHWLGGGQRLPCCCPTESTCKVGNYHCRCGSTYAHGRPAPPPAYHSGFTWPVWIIILLFLCCCCGCAKCCQRPRERRYHMISQPSNPPPYAPEYMSGQQQGGYQQGPYQMAYAVPAEGETSTRTGGGYTGTDMALSAAAGAAGGMLLDSLFNRGGESRYRERERDVFFSGGGGGDFDGDASYDGDNDDGDFAGDF